MGRTKRLTLAIMIVCAVLFVAAMVARKLAHPPTVLKACFHATPDLKKGSIVRVVGVDRGLVRSVSPQIGNPTCPVEVEFGLELPKGFQLPRNSTVSLETEGVLGPTYLEVDLAEQPGPPVREYEILATKEYTAGLTPQAATKLKKIIGNAIDGATAKPIDQTRRSEP